MRYLPLLTVPFLLTACFEDSGHPGRPLPPGVRCDAGSSQRFVGAAFRPQLGERAKRAARARTVRVIRPGEVVTMDFRDDRLNLEVDAQNRVRAVRCG